MQPRRLQSGQREGRLDPRSDPGGHCLQGLGWHCWQGIAAQQHPAACRAGQHPLQTPGSRAEGPSVLMLPAASLQHHPWNSRLLTLAPVVLPKPASRCSTDLSLFCYSRMPFFAPWGNASSWSSSYPHSSSSQWSVSSQHQHPLQPPPLQSRSADFCEQAAEPGVWGIGLLFCWEAGPGWEAA